jgi:hypothetical protein
MVAPDGRPGDRTGVLGRAAVDDELVGREHGYTGSGSLSGVFCWNLASSSL